MPVSPSAAERSERILILAPSGSDAEMTAQLLAENDIPAEPLPDSATLCREIDRGAGAVIITTEALNPESIAQLTAVLARQPRWSEIPILIFTAAGQQSEVLAQPYDSLGERAHLTLVDRPIRIRSLISATRSALRARSRQYEIRDLLVDLERHVDRLSGLAEASLAIASAGSIHEVLRMITDQACTLLEAEVAITRVVADFERGTPIGVASASERLREFASELTRPEVAEKADVVGTITEPLRDDRLVPAIFGEGAIEHGLRGLVAAPLVERDDTNIGFIAVSSREEGEFTTDDESVLVQLAQMASAVVQKARLYREAQDASRAKDDFLATLAHELRTPMTSILGWVQMLKTDSKESAEVGEAIAMIESSTRIQATLVEDLLDVSRIIAGKLKIVPAPTELGPLVESVIATFRNACNEKGVDLQSEIEPSPLSIWGDPTRLQQIVWNLLSNSIKFTPAGGTIRVSLERGGNDAVIRVQDSGEGIDAAFLPHVFERFEQGEGGTRRSHGGLGLGLAIVRHLVEAHGGSIGAASDGPGKGAKFTVRLPLSIVRIDENDDTAAITMALRGRKLLIVDDDEAARSMLKAALENFEANVETASSVGDALRSLSRFDAEMVISDLHMPGEDGYALIGRLRDLRSRFGREIPAIALTGYGRPEDRIRALGSGFRHYVQKPVELVSLARIAADLVARQ